MLRAIAGNDWIIHETWDEEYRHKTFTTKVSNLEVLAQSPAFDAERNTPPIPIAEIIYSARQTLQTLVPSGKDWEFTEITLQPTLVLDNERAPKRSAYYRVCFSSPEREINEGATSTARIIVLLTGEALAPESKDYIRLPRLDNPSPNPKDLENREKKP